MSLYPTTQPITNANINAFLAEALARKGAAMPPARINVRIKEDSKARIVASMAEQMLEHGEGMTEADLMRIGWSKEIVAICAPLVNQKALKRARAGLN